MSHRRTGAAFLAACASLALASPATSAAGTSTSRDVKVMTRNVYLGADLIPLATQPNREAFEQAAAERFQTVLDNDFATRAKALAKEIRREKPDVLALQEAATWRRSAEGVKDGTATTSTKVVYDSITLLQKELKKAGQRYRLAVKRPWFDYEAPTARGFDVRLTQNDAILVRRGSKVDFGKTFKGGFRDTFDVPTQVGLARSPRGWVGIDGKVGGRAFRFVTTHLEAYSAEIADKQMNQLLDQPLRSERKASILVGDFNSAPSDNQDDRGTERDDNAYDSAIFAGFFNGLPKRATCCFAEDLRKTTEPLETWIDHIVVRPKAKVVRSSIVGNRASDRLGGLYPSDHAGIAATLRLK